MSGKLVIIEWELVDGVEALRRCSCRVKRTNASQCRRGWGTITGTRQDDQCVFDRLMFSRFGSTYLISTPRARQGSSTDPSSSEYYTIILFTSAPSFRVLTRSASALLVRWELSCTSSSVSHLSSSVQISFSGKM